MKATTLFILVFISFLQIKAQQYLPPNQRAGELSYELINLHDDPFNPTVFYRFTLKMVVECQYLEPAVGNLWVTNMDRPGQPIPTPWKLDSASNRVDVADPCIAYTYPPCYRVYYFHIDTALGYNDFGYSIFYGDCCRDFFQNINTGNNLSSFEGADLQGAWGCGGLHYSRPCIGYVGNSIAYNAFIPSKYKIRQQSSAMFTNASDTILYVCINQPFSHSFSASDKDGDSLVYRFAPARMWYAEVTGCCIAMAADDNIEVPYKTPAYTPGAPLGKDVAIDAATGLLYGQLHDTGSFIVTLAVDEYRAGKKVTLSPHTRDVVLRAYDCSKLPVPKAAIPPVLNDCASYTVVFPNTSTPYHEELYWDNNKYLWKLGDGDTAQVRYPVHTYDTGIYNVQLITMPGYHCADTAEMKLFVYPAVKPAFTINGENCTGKPIKFANISTTEIGKINSIAWTFTNLKDSSFFTSKLSIPTYTFKVPNQTYSAVLDITTTKGCEAKDTQYINVWQSPLPLQTHDTILTIGQPYQLYADAGYDSAINRFVWSPAFGLDNPFIANPVVTATQDIAYTIHMVNAFGCTLTDTLHIVYYKGPDIYVPTAFTPNGDMKNDVLRPLPVGIKQIQYFRVFNRWGNVVYQTKEYRAGWDGYINGRQAPAGTYIYEAAGIDYNSKPVVKKGYVVLLR